MILCKFTKTDSAVFLPHLDLLREMGRAVRRADLKVAFSEGFNPHMLLYFSQPLPLGLPSVAEYFCADSKEDPFLFMTRLNEKLPRGVKILSATNVEKASVHAMTTRAAYRYHADRLLKKSELRDIMSRKTIVISVKTKHGMTDAEIREKIFLLDEDCGDAVAILGCGKNNLRADSFGNFLKAELKLERIEVEKIDAYIDFDSEVKTVDEFFGLPH